MALERLVSPLFLGSHAAVDFLNTSFAPYGEPIETIPDGRAYLEWCVGAGLVSQEESARLTRRFGLKASDAAAAEARKVREWARAWLARWRQAPADDYTEEIETLNKLLARQPQRLEVTFAGEAPRLTGIAHIESASALLGLIAVQIAKLFTEEPAELVKTCAGDACTLWFLDRTKSHRRMFCSTAACGNRAKVAAFRERQRQ